MDLSSFSLKHRHLVRAAVDFLVAHQSPRGDFQTPSSRCGYNEIYDAKAMFTVLQGVYMARRDPPLQERYLACLNRRLARFARSQSPDGSLPLDSAGGPGFVSVTGAVAAVVKRLGELTDVTAHLPMAHRCLDYITGVFTPENGFRTETNANALNFHDPFPLYALALWRDERPDAGALVGPATEYITQGKVWNAEGGFWKAGFGIMKGFDMEQLPHPTLDLDRTWVLFETCGTKYAEQSHRSALAIQKNLEAIESYYTEDSVRFAETRTRTALAALMATYDRYTGTRTFTNTQPFEELVSWSLSQFDEKEGGFRERVNLVTGQKEFYGVPAQYLSQYLFSCGLLNRDLSF
ncbi:MAG: hypothetical protein EXS64_12375 [Candidatus Latescibacteria bacterium]|nr:hypothetical protein [Candidatus Latescibacterota bacterium]